MGKSLACLLLAASIGHSLEYNVQFLSVGSQAYLRVLQVPAVEPLGAVHLKMRFRPEAGLKSVTVYRAADGAWSQVTPELRRDGNTVEVWALAPGIGESRDSTARTVMELLLPLQPTKTLSLAADLFDSVWVVESVGVQGSPVPLSQSFTTSAIGRARPPFHDAPVERLRGGRQTLSFLLGKKERVHAYVADARGKCAAEIFDRKLGPGLQEISWDRNKPGGKSLPAGTYFLRLEAGTFAYDRKLEVSP